MKCEGERVCREHEGNARELCRPVWPHSGPGEPGEFPHRGCVCKGTVFVSIQTVFTHLKGPACMISGVHEQCDLLYVTALEIMQSAIIISIITSH